MKNLLLLLGLLIPMIGFSQDWRVIQIGQCPTTDSYDLVLADGQNDGLQRLYVTTKDGGVYEWTYESGSWTMSHTVHPGPLNHLMHIAAGEARNDGLVRIYFAEWAQSARIFEASWMGSSWQIQLIGTAPDINTGVVVGAGRNDGKNRLYVSGAYGLSEWSWEGDKWNAMAISDTYHEVSGEIGDARNDGINRILMNTNCLSELSWVNSAFQQNNLECSVETWPDAVQIGEGRNDGVQRIYVNTTALADGRWEYSWNGSGWDTRVIESTPHRGDIHLARLKADGRNRVYTTSSAYWAGPANDLFEYEWDGNDWVKTGSVVDAVSGATAMLASGVGRNDDTLRMYTPNYVTGGIYEITHSQPFVKSTTSADEYPGSPLQFEVFPNPWYKGNLKVQLSSGTLTNRFDVELVNHLGHRIWYKYGIGGSEKLEIELSCAACSPGIYFLKITDKRGVLLSEKVVKF